MERRAALAAFAAAGSTVLSGCSLGSRAVHQEPSTAEKFTETSTPTADDTPTATETSTPSRRRGDVPDDRVLEGAAVSDDGLELTADRWFAFERLPYSEGSDDETKTVTTDVGRFVAYEFTLRNVGKSEMDSVPDAEFLLGIDGETFDHVHSFPGDVPFDAIDQPSSQPRIRPLAWYDSLDPGEGVSLQLVYEAPVRPDYRHYLVWDHGSPVEGFLEPVYLTGEHVPVDDG